jgi:hypothetical protein
MSTTNNSGHNSKPSRTRIRSSDLMTSMYSPKDQRVRSADEAETGTVVYTVNGKEDDKDPDGKPVLLDLEYEDGSKLLAERRDEAYAKVVVSDDRNRYYVKQGPNGKLFNPVGLYQEGNVNRKRAGESQWKYREVNKKVFDLYTQFLKTKNVAWLTNAEREVV